MRDRRRSAMLALTAAGLAVLAFTVPGTAGAFTAKITNTTDTAASKAAFTCSDMFTARADRAYFEYTLADFVDGTTATDKSSQGPKNNGHYEGAFASDTAVPKACPNDSGSPWKLNGTSDRITTSRQYDVTTDFSIEVWFKTNVENQKILGLEDQKTDTSSSYGKYLALYYGRLVYAHVTDGSAYLSYNAVSVADGAWHQAVVTVSGTTGVLYLDGDAQNTKALPTTSSSGYWRIGQGMVQVQGSSQGQSSAYTGSLRYAAAYKYAMTAAEVKSDYQIGQPG